MTEPWVPSALEVALGTVFGPFLEASALPEPAAGRSPRQVLEEVVRVALMRPPCGVSFSGGRDSSIVLAIATQVARREGFALPIPLTQVFPDVPASREDRWQELVVDALGLTDWVRLSWHDELDVLGPFSTTVLRRVGVLEPFNAFFHEPLCAQVSGGSLLTGIGGDEVLGGPNSAVFRIRQRRQRPRLRQLRPLALSFAPLPVRARKILQTGPFDDATWLRPAVRTAAARDYARWRASDPLPWDASLRRYWFSRDAQVGLAGLDALAGHHDVRLVHPLSSAEFIASMIATHGHAGPGGRATSTAALAGDLLPEALVQRPGKAAFGAAFWNGPHAEFADRWSGAGVDTSLVDVEVLRQEWRQPELRSFASLMLLQQAWLHDDGIASAGG